MAFLRADTDLALYGGPGPSSAPLALTDSSTDTLSVTLTEVAVVVILAALSATDTLSVSVTDDSAVATAEYDLYETQRGLHGGPAPYVELADKAIVTTFGLVVSDSLSVQWLEEPVDENQIVCADTQRVSVSETSQLLNYLAVTDTTSVQLSETVSLLQSGVTTKAVTDTLSVSLTDASSVGVTLSVTDDVSVSLTDTSSLLTPAQFIEAADAVSVSLTEDTPLLGIFTGVLDVLASDIVRVSTTDSAIQSVYVPPVFTETRPYRIRIVPRTARIRIITT
jgi:hypothetical protein